MKKYNIEEKTDVVILTICPNCGWFWVKEKDDEIVCKNCYKNLKNEYIEKYGKENFQESKFLDWVKENLIIPIPQDKLAKSDSGLLRVRDMCWGCGHTQSVVFYKDRKYWLCSKDGSKNYCFNLMQVINLHFNFLLNKPIKIMRITKFYKTPKGKARVAGQELKVLGESENILIKKGLMRWL